MVTETKLTQAQAADGKRRPGSPTARHAARAQIAASAALLFRGPLLGLYAKQAASEPRRARSARRGRSARRRPDRSTPGARGRLKAGT